MKILGIEGTAHTLGLAILENDNILSEKSSTLVPCKGLIPREMVEHHSQNFFKLLDSVLIDAGITINDLDLIAYSAGPGIGQNLNFVYNISKYLSMKYNIEILGVNHMIAHFEIIKRETDLYDPLILYVSGGNTQIVAQHSKKYYILGETQDIGIGNLFDMFARDLDLYPANAKKLFELRGNRYIQMPYTIKGMDVSFSGLYTYAKSLINKVDINDLVYSFTENALSMVVELVDRGISFTSKKELIVCGGVANNQRLRDMLELLAKENNIKFVNYKSNHYSDNGAMIAYLGYLMYKYHIKGEIFFEPKLRYDEKQYEWLKGIIKPREQFKGSESILKKQKFFGLNLSFLY